MPDAADAPDKVKSLPDSASPVVWVLWSLVNLNSNRLLIVLIVLGISVLFVDNRQDRAQTRQDYTEGILAARRAQAEDRDTYKKEQAERDEKFRAHTLEVVKTMQANCTASEKNRRDESTRHMKEAMDVLERLRVEIAKLRGSKVELPEQIDVAPIPKSIKDGEH